MYVQAFGNSTVLRHFLTARLQKVLGKSGSPIAVLPRGICGVVWNSSQFEDCCEKGGGNAIALFASTRNIDLDGDDNCTSRKIGCEEVQPDVSFYLGSIYNC